MNPSKSITVNNKPVQTEAQTLAELATELALPARGVAVAVSNKMVPRAEWENTTLPDNASVTIIKAACGG